MTYAAIVVVGMLALVGCRARGDRLANSTLFRNVANETGLKFFHCSGATGAFYMPEIMGAGVALLDYDVDGDLDVYLIQGGPLNASASLKDMLVPPPADWRPGNRLFRNELVDSGGLRFTDVTDRAGVGHVGHGMGVATGDYDNDGHPDMYVTNFGRNVLYHNNGDGTFSDVTAKAGVEDTRWSSSAAFLDYDGDGDLDLFVLNYLDFTVQGNKKCYVPSGELDYCTPKMYAPVPARLFRNTANGIFEDVTEASGIAKAAGPGLGVIASDFDSDGRMDLYVANDGTGNHLWWNRGNGRFEETGVASGVAYSADGAAQAGMGVSAGDFDGDGRQDLIVTNLSGEGSTLYRNLGKANFEDVTLQFGLLRLTFPCTGFGVNWLDYDNDGRLDLLAVNGAVTMMESQRSTPYPFQQMKQLFRNEGHQFRETTPETHATFSQPAVSRGAAFGDVDNDGDIDAVVANNNGYAELLLNDAAGPSHWLEILLDSGGANRRGIGGRIAVRTGDRLLWRWVQTDGSYLSANDVRTHFGLGDRTSAADVTVYWPDGYVEHWRGVIPDRQVTLRRGTGMRMVAANVSASVPGQANGFKLIRLNTRTYDDFGG